MDWFSIRSWWQQGPGGSWGDPSPDEIYNHTDIFWVLYQLDVSRRIPPKDFVQMLALSTITAWYVGETLAAVVGLGFGFGSRGQADHWSHGAPELQACRPPAGTDTESGASQAGHQAKEETNQECPFKSSPTLTAIHWGSSGAGFEPVFTLPEHKLLAGLQQRSANYLLKLM